LIGQGRHRTAANTVLARHALARCLIPSCAGAQWARQCLVAVHHRRRIDHRLWRHAHRQFCARLVLHAGAYLGVTLIPRLLEAASTFPAFLAGVLAAAAAVGAIGVAMELVLLRRIYAVPELFQLLATFGVVLAVEDLVLKLWGPLDILGPRAPG